jgi:hypothetical protein
LFLTLTRKTINGDLEKDETSLKLPYNNFNVSYAGYPIFSALEMIYKAGLDNLAFTPPTVLSKDVLDAIQNIQEKDILLSQRGFVQSFGIKADLSFFSFTMNFVDLEEDKKDDYGYCAGNICFQVGGFTGFLPAKEDPAAVQPTVSLQPSDEPTKMPEPSPEPTKKPSLKPTEFPSKEPTKKPSPVQTRSLVLTTPSPPSGPGCVQKCLNGFNLFCDNSAVVCLNNNVGSGAECGCACLGKTYLEGCNGQSDAASCCI